jgi:predicted O-linked N-acetylglucosamine transferase (SPINDLY family)
VESAVVGTAIDPSGHRRQEETADVSGEEVERAYIPSSSFRMSVTTNFDNECAHLISSVKNGEPNTAPFAFLAIPSSAEDQLQCANLWVAEKHPPSQKPIWRGEHYRHDRTRVAYLSSDFRNHAISFLMVGISECHDKSRFDVTAISLGPDDNSEMRQRLKASFERFIDATTYSDEQIANLVRSSEVDILVDLMGFTGDARTGIFAQRCAPIQVNYLGYPGTMGASYIDYIIADQTIIPDEFRRFYSEKIVFLPNTYQANDRKRGISDKAFTRSDVGLPSIKHKLAENRLTTPLFDTKLFTKHIEAAYTMIYERNQAGLASDHIVVPN